NFNPKSDSRSKHPFVCQKTATPYCLKCFPNAQIRASQDSSQISWEWRSAQAPNGNRNHTGGSAAARNNGMQRPVSEPVPVKWRK
ncbi:MAG: hypothetical protein ACREDG_02300, partial [Methylocella sp.]